MQLLGLPLPVAADAEVQADELPELASTASVAVLPPAPR